MARLATLPKGQWDQFDRLLSMSDLTAEEVLKLIQNPVLIKAMLSTMRDHPIYRLIHGRFHTLDEKIEIVKGWPGIANRYTEADFKAAVEEARDSGLLGRFEAASPKMPLLNVVVSVYLGSVVETFRYGRDRLRDTFGDRFVQDERYDRPDLDQCLVLFDGIKEHRNCIKVEVVDLGARLKDGSEYIPEDFRITKSAHVQVLYAGAEDADWVRLINPDQGVPYPLMGGYVTKLPGRDIKSSGVPELWFDGRQGTVKLGDNWSDRNSGYSSPVVWK